MKIGEKTIHDGHMFELKSIQHYFHPCEGCYFYDSGRECPKIGDTAELLCESYGGDSGVFIESSKAPYIALNKEQFDILYGRVIQLRKLLTETDGRIDDLNAAHEAIVMLREKESNKYEINKQL